MSEWWNALLQALAFKARYWFGLALAAALIRFLPEPAAELIGLTQVRDGPLGWVAGVVLVVSAVFWLVRCADWVQERIQSRGRAKNEAYAIQKASENVRERIRNAPLDERRILADCLRRKSETTNLFLTDKAAMALCHKGLLQKAEPTTNRMAIPAANWPFVVPPAVWSELSKMSPDELEKA